MNKKNIEKRIANCQKRILRLSIKTIILLILLNAIFPFCAAEKRLINANLLAKTYESYNPYNDLEYLTRETLSDNLKTSFEKRRETYNSNNPLIKWYSNLKKFPKIIMSLIIPFATLILGCKIFSTAKLLLKAIQKLLFLSNKKRRRKIRKASIRLS